MSILLLNQEKKASIMLIVKFIIENKYIKILLKYNGYILVLKQYFLKNYLNDKYNLNYIKEFLYEIGFLRITKN